MKKLSFFLMAMLMSVMSFAAEYTIVFKSAGSDSNTDLGAAPNVSSVVSEGTSYVASFSGCAKIYVGVNGIKLGSSKAAGTLNFNLATLCQANVKSIKVVSAKYSNDTGKLTLAVNGTNVKTDITPGTDYTHTYNAPTKVESIKLYTSSKRAYITKVIITTEEEVDPDAVYYTIKTAVNDATMGKAEGGGEYKENTKISLTATPNSGYEFVKWSNESTANPLEVTVTEDATYTAIFQEQTPITCSQIKDLSIGDAFVLGEFTVTYVNGSYTYIKDATGASLIYASNYGLKAGDVVTGLAGTRANFNGLVQITPTVTKAQLTITAGTAPQPEVATANPTQADMNKYVKYEQVTFDATAFSSKKINATLAGQTTKFAVYDQWNTNKTFVKGGTYEFIGAVSYYNAVQVNFISATKVSLTISATATGGKVTGTGEYMEGEEATLIATANEGYEFVNWTWADEVVCTTPEYTFEVEEAMSLVANFKEAEPEIEWMEMDLEITNLVTEVMEVEGAKFLQLMGRDDMNDADVTLFLNNYADVDDDYVVNAGSSYMTFGGTELTVLEGTMTQTSETEKGTIYTGTVRASAEEEGETMYLEFTLTTYAAPATVLVLADAIVAINEELGTLTFNVPTGEDEGYYAELAGYTAPGVHQGPQICLFSTPEVVSYTNYAETSVADGIITLKGEFTSPMGPKFNLTISGKLPGSATALDNLNTTVAPVKAIINGQLIIINNGVQYNAQGQVIK